MSSERRDWSRRNWQADSYSQAVDEAHQMEALMRNILKLFSSGCLVYRSRTKQGQPVLTKSDRLKRIRRRLDPVGVDGTAQVA